MKKKPFQHDFMFLSWRGAPFVKDFINVGLSTRTVNVLAHNEIKNLPHLVSLGSVKMHKLERLGSVGANELVSLIKKRTGKNFAPKPKPRCLHCGQVLPNAKKN